MSLSIRSEQGAALLEKVITSNDLSGLSSMEKVTHIKNMCESLGLNPLTKPIQLLKFQGKEIAYFTKDATEQLRKSNNVSITKVENKMLDNATYVVTVYAQTPDGRTDASTGAICIAGLRGNDLCNAMLKAETKAKRRVTLSICGLGFIDESEADSISNATKINAYQVQPEVKHIDSTPQYDVGEMLLDISQTDSIENLQQVFEDHYKNLVQTRDKEALTRLIKAKDEKKEKLKLVSDFNKEIDEQKNEEK